MFGAKWFGTLALVAGLCGSSIAQGSDDACYRTVTVVSFETRKVPTIVWKTVYDECGHRKRVAVTVYRTVTVAVERTVRVAD